MDPITQGVLGAAAGQLNSRPIHLFYATVLGALGGMAADLDVLIRSSSDPMLALAFHRHFTHSLFFIPFGGAICGIALYFLFGKRWRISLRQAITWSTLGYATHALLDGCTSYGTQLLWPLSDQRFSWDIISVVDGLLTIPLLIAVLLTLKTKSKYWLMAGLIWCGFYLSFGFFQHQRVIDIEQELADSRHHNDVTIEAKPSFGNLFVWKAVYEFDGVFYVDAIKPGISKNVIWEGASIAKLNLARDFPWLDKSAQQYKDILKFDWFSAGYTAVDPDDSDRIIDIRYSMLPQEVDPLWGIEISRQKSDDDHVVYYTQRNNSGEALKTLIEMVFE